MDILKLDDIQVIKCLAYHIVKFHHIRCSQEIIDITVYVLKYLSDTSIKIHSIIMTNPNMFHENILTKKNSDINLLY